MTENSSTNFKPTAATVAKKIAIRRKKNENFTFSMHASRNPYISIDISQSLYYITILPNTVCYNICRYFKPSIHKFEYLYLNLLIFSVEYNFFFSSIFHFIVLTSVNFKYWHLYAFHWILLRFFILFPFFLFELAQQTDFVALALFHLYSILVCAC